MGRPGLTQHRKFRRLARALGSDCLARGCLEFLWDSCYENGDDYLGDAHDVEAAARWSGAPGELVIALLDAGGEDFAGFIEAIPDRAERYMVHDLWHHAPDYVRKRRKREAERRSKTDPVGMDCELSPDNDRSVTGKRRVSPDCQAVVDLTPAPALKENPLSEREVCSDVTKVTLRKNPTAVPSQQAARLAALLKSEIRRNKADYRVTPAHERAWGVTAQRMLDIDKRAPEHIAKLIRWVQQDEFEMANVLSMDKLRARFDQLELKARPKGSKNVAAVPLPATYVPASEKLLQERCAGGMQ